MAVVVYRICAAICAEAAFTAILWLHVIERRCDR